MSRFVGKTGPSGVKGIRSDSEFTTIEGLIKESTFSRDEFNRLVEILNSRVEIDPDKNEHRFRVGADALMHELPRTPIAEKQPDSERTVVGTFLETKEVPRGAGVGPSPIEIARAFMASRTSGHGQDLNNYASNSERVQMSNEFARNPILPSPSPKQSICWPGAMVQDNHGFTSPQSQRGRYGVRDFPRTPYSRTNLSKSTTRLLDETKLTNTSSPFQQSQTSNFGQMSSRAEAVDSYGSVGPIRRIRSRFGSEFRPKESIFLNSPKGVPSKTEQPSIFRNPLPSTEKNLEPGEINGSLNNWSVANVSGSPDGGSRDPCSTPSSQAVSKKILEHLDRNKPTPKEKEEELKLATSWRNSSASGASDTVREESFNAQQLSSQKSTGVGGLSYPMDFTKSKSNSSRSVRFQEGRLNDSTDADNDKAKASSFMFGNSSRIGNILQPYGIKGNSDSVVNNSHENSLVDTDRGKKVTSLDFTRPQLSNGQDFKSLATPSDSQPSKSSPRTKPSLPSISINKPHPRPVSADNGPGFTFQYSSSSGALSEPPTPSFIPSASISSSSQPQSVSTVPSYSFGANNYARVNFSFPSTSNASIPENSDLKYTFGSDDSKTERLSFSSLKKNSVCY